MRDRESFDRLRERVAEDPGLLDPERRLILDPALDYELEVRLPEAVAGAVILASSPFRELEGPRIEWHDFAQPVTLRDDETIELRGPDDA